MSSNSGMNIEDVRALGRDLQMATDDLRTRAKQLSSRVAAVDWEGDDANAFKRDWWPKHLKSLEQALVALHGLGQSALNNAEEQAQASGGRNGSGGGPGAGGIGGGGIGGTGGTGGGTPHPGTPGGGNSGNGYPGWGEQISHDQMRQIALDHIPEGSRRVYDFNNGDGQGDDWFQCTVWAKARWAQMGYTGPEWRGDGSDVASNINALLGRPNETVPSQGAIASYDGHVMVVEEARDNGNGTWSIRVSEFNQSSNGWQIATPDEFKTDRWITGTPGGSWTSYKSHGAMTFASFPG